MNGLQPDLSVLAAGALEGNAAFGGAEDGNGRGSKRAREEDGSEDMMMAQHGLDANGEIVIPEDDEDLEGLDDEEKRKVIRQKRNRLSAQLSRDRKKNYVQKLIGQNAQLTSCCKKLLQENRELRTAVAIYRGTSLQALGASAALGAGLGNPAVASMATPLASLAGSNAEMGIMAAAAAAAAAGESQPPVSQ